MSKKILIVSTIPSHPQTGGNRTVIMTHAELLQSMGHEVHFLFVETAIDRQPLAEMKSYWKDRFLCFNENIWDKVRRKAIDIYRQKITHGYWKADDNFVPGLGRYINSLNRKNNYDAVIIHYYYLSKLFLQIDIPIKAVFTHDLFSLKNLKVGYQFYRSLMPNDEAKALQRCPKILSIQSNEANYFKELAPKSNVFTVYSPFQIQPLPLQSDYKLLYIAANCEVNFQGIHWFLKNVWHRLLEMNPSFQLYIAGTICEAITNDIPNVKLLNRVESLREFYSLGSIVINPVFKGTGLKIKTFEGLAYGRLVIAMPHSMEGVYDPEKCPIIIADKPDEWVSVITQVAGSEELLKAKSQEAVAYIRNLNQYIRQQYNVLLGENSNI